MKLLHKLGSLLVPIGIMLMIYYRDMFNITCLSWGIISIGSFCLYKGFESVRNSIRYNYFISIFWIFFIIFSHSYIETYFNPLAIICSLCFWSIIVLLDKKYLTMGFFTIINSISYLLFFILFKLMQWDQ